MLPQLDYSTYPSQIFWLVINFSLLYFCISTIVVPRLDKIINKRNEVVESNRKETTINSQMEKSEQEKYNKAINKANIMAQDIVKDNQLLLEEKKIIAYKNLKKEIAVLNQDKKQEIEEFLNNKKSEAKNEIVNIINIYYNRIGLETINNGEQEKLKQEVEDLL